MQNPNLSESELLKSLLEPLLDDFQVWFSSARTLLTTKELIALGTEKQADLLARVIQAQQEVTAAQSLLQATDCQVGVEASVLVTWHQLVTEYWQISAQDRRDKSRGLPKQI